MGQATPAAGMTCKKFPSVLHACMAVIIARRGLITIVSGVLLPLYPDRFFLTNYIICRNVEIFFPKSAFFQKPEFCEGNQRIFSSAHEYSLFFAPNLQN